MNKIEYTERDGYGVLKINRPDKRNAITLKMASELNHILSEAKERPIKLLLLKSSGDASFCAGGDLNDFHSDLTEEEAYAALDMMKSVLKKLVDFPVPTICLLQANAFGGGCELATSCDIRIAKEKTSFGFVQTNLGILPGWGGGAILYKKVHPNFAFQWITEGAIYPATFLKEKSWLHHVIPTEQWNDEEQVLQQYTNKSYEQMSFLKKQYKESLSLSTLYREMDEESIESAKHWGSEVHKAALQRFFSKK